MVVFIFEHYKHILCFSTCGPLLQVNDVGPRRMGLIKFTGVTVWPDGALVICAVILASEDEMEFLLVEEALHEAEVKRGHTHAI